MSARALLAVTVLLLASAAFAGCASKPPPTTPATACSSTTRAGLDLVDRLDSVVAMDTNKGCIVIELYDAKAPKTVANFRQYVSEKFYDNVCFHRIIPGFVVQGGGFDRASCGTSHKETHANIPLETQSKLRNEQRTLAMARMQAPNTASSEFFFNTVTNCFLDPPSYSTCPDKSVSPDGYAVFGKVVQGWDVVVLLEKAGTQAGTPTESVYMTAVRLVEGSATGSSAPSTATSATTNSTATSTSTSSSSTSPYPG